MLFILLAIGFVIIFLTVHLTLQSIVLPQAWSNLFAAIIISKEQDIQKQFAIRLSKVSLQRCAQLPCH